MTDLRDWSVTASANNGTSANGFFAENMAYSEVNDAAREMQAIIARYHADNNGTLLSTGETNSYNLAINQSLSSYAAGDLFLWKAHKKNIGATVVRVDKVGATATVVYNADGSALREGAILANGIYEIVYDGSNFRLLNPSVPVYNGDTIPFEIFQRTPAAVGIQVKISATGNTEFYDATANGSTSNPWMVRSAAAGTIFQDSTDGTQVLTIAGKNMIPPLRNVADLATQTATGAIAFVLDLSGGAALCYNAGGAWKRASDGTNAD